MSHRDIFSFKAGSAWGGILAEWHRSLEHDTGGRAELRSCRTPVDVVFVPAYHRLLHDLIRRAGNVIEHGDVDTSPEWIEKRLRERLPVIAGLIAHIEPQGKGKDSASDSDDTNPEGDEPDSVNIESNGRKTTLAQKMAQVRSSGGGPLVSGLRFRRLLKCNDPEDLYSPLRRIVKMLKKDLTIFLIADDVYFWGDDRRKRWAYDYYATAPAQTE
jgi:CRISPR system Cascade subunit CasB